MSGRSSDGAPGWEHGAGDPAPDADAEESAEPLADPLVQGEIDTLEAELRAALQHRDAEVERMQEAQQRVEELLSRAKKLLKKASPPPEP